MFWNGREWRDNMQTLLLWAIFCIEIFKFYCKNHRKNKNLNKLCNFSSLPYFFNIAHLCNCVNYALMFSLKKLTMLMRYMIYATRRWFKCIKRKLSFQFTTLTIHDELLFKWNVLKANCTKKKKRKVAKSKKLLLCLSHPHSLPYCHFLAILWLFQQKKSSRVRWEALCNFLSCSMLKVKE